MPPPPKLPDSNTSLTYTTPSSPPHLTHTPLPLPAPNQVLVKIHAAAINPVDIQLWGNPVVGWLAGSKEKGIGRDYSGKIVAVGEELTGKWEVGDEVFGLCNRPVSFFAIYFLHFRVYIAGLVGFWEVGGKKELSTCIISAFPEYPFFSFSCFPSFSRRRP